MKLSARLMAIPSLGIELEVEFVEPLAGVVERAVCAFESVHEHDEGRFHHLLFFFFADTGFEGLVGIEGATDDFAGGDLFFCGQLFEFFAVAVAEQDYGSAVCALGFCRGGHVLRVAHVHSMCIKYEQQVHVGDDNKKNNSISGDRGGLACLRGFDPLFRGR